MISDQVNLRTEAVIQVMIRDATGQILNQKAIIDTGFSGYLTLANANRRGNRILRVAVFLGIATLIMTVFAWTLRPKWRTYTFPADPKTGMAVAIDYPDNLEIHPSDSLLDTSHNLKTFGDEMDLVLAPHPPGELVRWWQTHVLRQDENSGEEIMIFVDSGKSYISVSDIEQLVANVARTPRTTLHITHTHHALGPAMEAWGVLGDTIVGGVSNNTLVQAHGAAIWPRKTTGVDKVSILMLALAPVPLYGKVGPAAKAMIPRVHLVHTGRSSPHEADRAPTRSAPAAR